MLRLRQKSSAKCASTDPTRPLMRLDPRDAVRFSALRSSAEILAGAANPYHAARTRRVSAAGLAPTSGEVVTQFQSDSSRTDLPVRILHAQPGSPVSNASTYDGLSKTARYRKVSQICLSRSIVSRPDGSSAQSPRRLKPRADATTGRCHLRAQRTDTSGHPGSAKNRRDQMDLAASAVGRDVLVRQPDVRRKKLPVCQNTSIGIPPRGDQ